MSQRVALERRVATGVIAWHPRLRSSRSAWALAFLGGLLVLWVWLAFEAIVNSPGPNGAVFGVDFSHTYAAIQLLSTGHNPYDVQSLSRVQHAVMARYGLPVQPRSLSVLVGTSTFFLFILEPLRTVPYQTAAIAWMLGTYAFMGFAFLAVVRQLGWSRRGLPTVLFLASPVVVIATYDGNTISVVFAGIAGGFALLRRHPFLAGVLLSLAIVKFPVALPIVGLIVLFHTPRKRWVGGGLLVAFLCRQVLTLALLGKQYESWRVGSLLGFSHSMPTQPNVSSLSGLYAQLLPETARLVLEVLSVGLAGAMTLVFWWRTRHEPTLPLLRTGWLWFVWLIATPYAHYIDEMLLVIPVLALIGYDGRRISRPLSVSVLYLLGLSILLYSWTPMHMQLLWAPLAVCACCFGLVSFRYSRGDIEWRDSDSVHVGARDVVRGIPRVVEHALHAAG
jgi:Glycosyltransferase family 87